MSTYRTTHWHSFGPRFKRLLAMAAGAALWLLIAGFTLWGLLAIRFQTEGIVRWAVLAAWCSASIAMLAWLAKPKWRDRARWPAIVFAISGLALLGGWLALRPSHDRIWADDVARLLRAEVEGSRVTLHNVRNFEWRSEDDYTARWETREYDLDRVASADLFLSYWMGPQIAHTLISFGFDDGRQVVFSLEIRKERGESFSAIGGFFRKFEQILVAADERDIIRTRSNVRGEDVHLYRLKMSRDDLRRLFLGYLADAEALRREPRFYNTLTSNCTTIVYDLARKIAPRLPLDYRLVLSGYFAEYVYDLGGLADGHESAELQFSGHINDRALASDLSGEDYSVAIRRGVPGIPKPNEE